MNMREPMTQGSYMTTESRAQAQYDPRFYGIGVPPQPLLPNPETYIQRPVGIPIKTHKEVWFSGCHSGTYSLLPPR